MCIILYYLSFWHYMYILYCCYLQIKKEPSWLWSYGSCIYNRCPSSVKYFLTLHSCNWINEWMNKLIICCFFIWFMLFNASFRNISVISWRSVLLVRKPEYPVKTTDLSQVTDKLYHIMLFMLFGFTTIYALIAHVVINTTTMRSQPRRPLLDL
jgi:hypothetical protein